MSDEPIKLQDRLEWALMTIREKLNFGVGEAEGIKRRECRVRGVLIEAVDELPKIEQELSQARKLIAELVKMGEFYGNENRWSAPIMRQGREVSMPKIETQIDAGKLAREVLEKNKEIIKNFGASL